MSCWALKGGIVFTFASRLQEVGIGVHEINIPHSKGFEKSTWISWKSKNVKYEPNFQILQNKNNEKSPITVFKFNFGIKYTN